MITFHAAISDEQALRPTRAEVARRLHGAGWSHDAVGLALVVSSELVTNALMHGRRPVELVVEDEGDRARICVRDHDPNGPVPRAAQGERGGYGLQLIARAARAWGWDADHDGKVVWAVVDRNR